MRCVTSALLFLACLAGCRDLDIVVDPLGPMDARSLAVVLLDAPAVDHGATSADDSRALTREVVVELRARRDPALRIVPPEKLEALPDSPAETPPTTIASKTGCDYVLSGRLVHHADSLEVTLSLFETGDASIDPTGDPAAGAGDRLLRPITVARAADDPTDENALATILRQRAARAIADALVGRARTGDEER